MRPKEVPVVSGGVWAGGEKPPATRLFVNLYLYIYQTDLFIFFKIKLNLGLDNIAPINVIAKNGYYNVMSLRLIETIQPKPAIESIK